MVITNLVIFSVLTVLGYWWAYFVLWLLPMATWMMMITRLRNIGEHAVVPDNNDPMRHARTTLANPLEGLLLAPYWVNYHCEHHMFMHVPCYNLPRVHRLMREKGVLGGMLTAPSYLDVLRQAASLPSSQDTGGNATPEARGVRRALIQ
jgi:fatty acid desaturase